MRAALLWTSCGTQRLLRPLSGPCILLATAPTAPPCFGRRPQSSPLQYQRKIIFIICSSETTAVVSELLFHGRGLFGKAAGSFLSKFRRSGAPVRSTGAEQGVPDSFAKESSPPPAITAGSSARPRPRRGSAHRWRAGCARGSGGGWPAPRYQPAPPRQWSGSFSG